MGVMVLHFAQRQAGVALLNGPFAREVFGVHVACNGVGRRFEQRLEAAERLEPGVVGIGVLQIADVLADKRLVAAQQAERVLLLGAGGHDRAAFRMLGKGDRHGHGRVSSCPAHRLHRFALAADGDYAHHRVVEAAAYGAVVAHERVGDAA